MKANEYIKNYGWICAGIKIAEIEHSKDFDGFYSDLKRLIESHELVEKFGGLEKSRKHLNERCVFEWTALDGKLSQSICDVESCQ